MNARKTGVFDARRVYRGTASIEGAIGQPNHCLETCISIAFSAEKLRGRKMESVTLRAIFNWKSGLVLAFGILLKLSAPAIAELSYAWTGTLAGEIGTALLVAVFVWAFFELASRRQQEERIDQRIERITKNVFFGVFRRDLPEGLIDEASRLVLENDIIRRDFSVTYTLSDDTYQAAGGRSMPFVRLRAVSRFILKNVGLDPREIPIAVGLPNPIAPGMVEKSDVVSIKIRRKGEDERTLDLTSAKEEMKAGMLDSNNHLCNCLGMKYTLQPDEEIHITADYIMAKEVEDTEVLQSRYPSDGLALTVIDTAPNKRFVRARSIHRAQLKDDSGSREDGTHIYTLDYHLLPHQGVMVWWKSRGDTPQPEARAAG